MDEVSWQNGLHETCCGGFRAGRNEDFDRLGSDVDSVVGHRIRAAMVRAPELSHPPAAGRYAAPATGPFE